MSDLISSHCFEYGESQSAVNWLRCSPPAALRGRAAECECDFIQQVTFGSLPLSVTSTFSLTLTLPFKKETDILQTHMLNKAQSYTVARDLLFRVVKFFNPSPNLIIVINYKKKIERYMLICFP